MLLLLLACTPESTTPEIRQGPQDTAVSSCRPSSEDRVHTVVVGQPFATPNNTWRSYALEGETLTETGSFTMGEGTFGRVVWTPDGRVGAVAQDDGTVGIFAAEQGQVSVIEAAFQDGFYASALTMDPDGETLWVVDGNWANNGGGLYRVSLDCETGSPGATEKVRESKLASALLIGERTVLVAHEVDDQGGFSAYELASPEDEVLQGLPLFEHADYSISDAVMAPDGRIWAADYSVFSGVPHSVSVLNADLSLKDRIPVVDPVALVAHPGDGRMLALSAYQGDELLQIAPDLEVDRLQSSPLPWAAAGLHTGPDAGLVVVSENQAMLLLRWTSAGMEELQSVALSGDALPGAIGVSP